jgi:hypothetical protein
MARAANRRSWVVGVVSVGESVPSGQEVIPVNVSTWVLLSEVTVGR